MSRGASGKRLQSRRMAEVKKQIQFEIGHALFIDALPKALRGKTEVNPRDFFSELKRRNVYKVAVAYAVVAWLLIQAASIFFPAFDAPPWVMKIFIIVIFFGFPVGLIFSWA